MKKIYLLTLLTILVQNGWSQGILTGTIIDEEYNDILPFATVIIKELQDGTTTDFDGKYTLKANPGNYTIQFSYLGYQTLEINDVIIKEGETTYLDIALQPITGQLSEVVVTGTPKQNTISAVLKIQQNSVSLMDGLSLEIINKMGAGNIANAVTNVPGVSVQEGKFVYVRGLGDRYTKSILNGMDVPGLDPDRNTLQLDIFPTKILENLIVTKSSTADQPADFTGGVVDIVTKDIPTRKEFSVSLGVGYNPSFHFNKNYLTGTRSKTDFLGFDNGLRKDPIPDGRGIPLPQQDGTTVRALTQKFSPDLAVIKKRSFMDYDFSVTGGNQYDIGKNKLGFLASVSYKNETKYYDKYMDGQVFRKHTDHSINDLRIDRLQQGQLGNNNVLLSGLAGISLKTDKAQYKLNLLHIQNGEREASQFQQSNRIISINEIKKDNSIYTQRSITNLLFSGKNTNEDANWTIEYKLSPSFAHIEDKDFKVTPFRITENPNTGDRTYTIEPSESGDPIRIYRNLKEVNLPGRIDITKKHQLFGRNAKLKFGGAYNYKQRDFNVVQYSFLLLKIASEGLEGDPNQLLAPENIYDPHTGEGVYVRKVSGISDTYNANTSVAAAYISEEFRLARWLNAVLGLRYEKYDLVYTGQRQDGTQFNQAKILNKSDFFPSANLIFDLNKETTNKIRASYSRTTARPSFKEASLAEIFDPISSTFFIGNIDIQPTYINNFDLRFEKYSQQRDFFAASAFYKSFKDPIEISFIRGASGQFTPLNLGDAKVFGGEIEIRKNLGFIPALKDFHFNTNISVIKSQQQFSADEKANRQDNLRTGESLDAHRQLQGQSPYLINLGFSYDNKEIGLQAGAFYNVQGKTLQIVGAEDIPDVYTLPYHNLKFNISKTFGKNNNSALSLKVDNLLNRDMVSIYQSYGSEDQIYSKWNPAQKFSLSYSMNF